MRKIAIFFSALLFCLFILSACSNDDNDTGKGIGDHGGEPPTKKKREFYNAEPNQSDSLNVK